MGVEAQGGPLGGELAKPVTMRDVAQHAGVSRSTVSYALTQPERLSKETLQRVTKSIGALGYIGNDAARQLRVGRSRALGLIVSNMMNPIYAEMANGADTEATRHGRFVLLANSRESAQRELEHIAFFESQQVTGVLIAPVARVPARLLEIRRRGTPFVVIGSPAEPGDYPYLSGDNEEGGYLAMAHLLAQDRRRVLFVGGSHHHVDDRLRGARRAIRAAKDGGLSLKVTRVKHQTAADGGRAAAALLAMPRPLLPDGIFAGNDLLALGLLHALLGGGVRVPEDVSLVGYDDIEFAEFAIVPLTSVRHPSAELGASAVRLLMGGAGLGDAVVERQAFKPELITRNSSLPVN